MKNEPNEALERIRMLVTESAFSPLRGGHFPRQAYESLSLSVRQNKQMKRSRIYLYLLAGLLLISLLISAVAYYQPTRIEDLDRLLYCACGYSTVKFDNGRIVMVRYHHDNVKPGDQIGTYRVDGTRIEFDTVFGANKHHETLELDHIGLIEPTEPMQMFAYRAVNSKSWKMRIYGVLKKVGLE